MDLSWHKRPSLSIREVQRLTGDTLAGIEEKLADGRLRGPQPGLIWPSAVRDVYEESAQPTPASRLPGRLGRRARSTARKMEETG